MRKVIRLGFPELAGPFQFPYADRTNIVAWISPYLWSVRSALDPTKDSQGPRFKSIRAFLPRQNM